MKGTFFCRHQRRVAFATLSMLLAFRGTTNAAEPEEPGPDTKVSSDEETQLLAPKASATWSRGYSLPVHASHPS